MGPEVFGGRQAGRYPIIIFGTEHARHADIRINAHSGAGVAELIATGNRPCLIDLRGMRVGERARFFVDFAASFFTHARGQRVLAIDEVHNFAPQGKVPDPQTGEMLHWVNRLISEGGGMGITMLSASQRPQKVHKDFVTSNETLIATRVIHKLDRDAVKDWIDACGDPAVGKEVLASLAGMQRTEAWVYSPEAGFGPAQLTFPMFKTYDSFKPQSDKQTGKLKGWASIDLKEVETKLASVVEEAKANDPKELRKQVAELTAEIKKLKATPAAVPVDKPAEKKAVADRIAKATTRGKVDGYGEAMKDITAIFRDLAPTMAKLLPIATSIEESGRRIKGWAARTRERQAELAKQIPEVPTALPAAAPRAPGAPCPARDPAANGSGHASGSLNNSEQKIVDAIRWWNVLGIPAPSHAQAAFIAGYSHKSGTWATYLSRLRSAGMIEGRGDLVLTEAGLSAAKEPDAVPNREALWNAVLGKIDAPLQKILKPIIAQYPEALSHAAAGEAAGYSPSSGTWATYLSRLRSLDLIEGRGDLKAQGWLFP